MIHAETPRGTKNLILRGWEGPRGLKGFTQGRITTPAGDKQFWDGAVAALTVSVSPLTVSGASASHGGSAPVGTASCTATASGGSPPYTYAWALVTDDGLGGTWSALSPTNATTAFKASAVPPNEVSLATFQCTATDARGATGATDVFASAITYVI